MFYTLTRLDRLAEEPSPKPPVLTPRGLYVACGLSAPVNPFLPAACLDYKRQAPAFEHMAAAEAWGGNAPRRGKSGDHKSGIPLTGRSPHNPAQLGPLAAPTRRGRDDSSSSASRPSGETHAELWSPLILANTAAVFGMPTRYASSPRLKPAISIRQIRGRHGSSSCAVLKVSSDTVNRDWRLARAWLLAELGDPQNEKH